MDKKRLLKYNRHRTRKKNNMVCRSDDNTKKIRRFSNASRKKKQQLSFEKSTSNYKYFKEGFDVAFYLYHKRKLSRCQHCETCFIKPDEINSYLQHLQNIRCDTCKAKFACMTYLKEHLLQSGHTQIYNVEATSENISKCCFNIDRNGQCKEHKNTLCSPPKEKKSKWSKKYFEILKTKTTKVQKAPVLRVKRATLNKFICNFCEIAHCSKVKLRSHVKKHLFVIKKKQQSAKGPPICPFCTLRCPDQVSLSSHLIKKKCAVCKEEIRCAVDVLVHQKTCVVKKVTPTIIFIDLEDETETKPQIKREMIDKIVKKEPVDCLNGASIGDWVESWIKVENDRA